jgi:hypothetical protein
MIFVLSEVILLLIFAQDVLCGYQYRMSQADQNKAMRDGSKEAQK